MENNFTPEVDKEGIKPTIRLPITHNFTMFLIGLIVIGLVASVSYTYLNIVNKPQKYGCGPGDVQGPLTDCLNPNKNDPSNWKTYRNGEYGFEFKYPQGFTTEEYSSVYPEEVIDPGTDGKYSWVNLKGGESFVKGSFYKDVSCEYIKKMGVDCDFSPVKKMREGLYYLGDTVIDGQKAVKILSCNVGCSMSIFVKYDGRLYDLSYDITDLVSFVNNKPVVKENSEFEKILSTFKFTNKYDTFDPDGTLSDISVNPVFKKWLSDNQVSYSIIESSNFSTSKIKKIDSYNGGNCDTQNGLKLSTSPDGYKSMCFGSAGEPDSDLYLYGKTDNTSVRLAFCGTPCAYQSGFWLDNNKFVFLWAMYDYEYDNKMKQYHELHVDLYNLSEDKIYSWTTKHLY